MKKNSSVIHKDAVKNFVTILEKSMFSKGKVYPIEVKPLKDRPNFCMVTVTE